jgi:hypothetical protein
LQNKHYLAVAILQYSAVLRRMQCAARQKPAAQNGSFFKEVSLETSRFAPQVFIGSVNR